MNPIVSHLSPSVFVGVKKSTGSLRINSPTRFTSETIPQNYETSHLCSHRARCPQLGLHATALDSRISAVTVYTDRAMVTRSAHASLTAGINELVFENLPAGLLDQSLQVSGRGTGDATILDVSARQTYLAATPDPRAKELEGKIEGLQQQDRTLNDRATVLRGQSEIINRLQASAVAPGGKDVDRPKLDDVKTLLTYGQTQLIEIATALQSIDRERGELRDRIDALQRQHNELRGTGARSVKTVMVRVQATAASSLEVSLAYTVGGASWHPSYDARVLTGERAVQLGYFGNVRQNTGEDWTNVALTLSTARPSLGGSAPLLGVWGLDVWQPEVYALSLPAVQSDKDSGYRKSRMTLSAAAPEMRVADVAQATVESGTTSATFKIAVPATIPSDNSSQKVLVTAARLNAITDYATTPKLQATAFLSARVINTTDYPFLGGAMSVFLDGTFVATSSLRTTMPKEDFELALGADEGISIEHKRVNRFTEQTGLISSGLRITYEYLITVQNNKRTEERVVVTDQIPVSRNEKIVVKVLTPTVKDLKPTDEGALKWTLTLKPGEKREIPIKFTVDHPAELKVDGLE